MPSKPIARLIATIAAAGLLQSAALAGPYSQARDDDANAYDAPVPGWVGPDGVGYAHVETWYPHPNNQVNPAFDFWASRVVDYDTPGGVDAGWDDPSYALGPATGDEIDIVCLGEMTADQLAAWHALGEAAPARPGSITLGFDQAIHNGPGPDLAVFENAFANTASAAIFAELAFVEVSTDGASFARFPARSLTAEPIDDDAHRYMHQDASDLYNLAGKHVNGYGVSWGTPFDLAELADHPLVLGGAVDLGEIHYVRIVDIPGDGSFADSTGAAIYDAWPTWGSGGFDLDAVGVLNQKTLLPGDANADGHVNVADFVTLKQNYNTPAGASWSQGDFDGDGAVNVNDFIILKQNYNR